MPKLKIFIAGHKGMVGSAIFRQLKDQEVEIITKNREQLNLLNQQDVQNFFKNEKIDQVYLAAAKVGGIHANNTYPAEFIYQNLMIQNNIIYASHLAGVKNLIFLGSSCIYPKFAKQPIDETEFLNGKLEVTNQSYAVAKIAGVEMCRAYNEQFNTNYKCLMPSNLYGPNDNYNSNSSHFFAAAIRKIYEAKINKLTKVKFWGSGKPKREALFVYDLAEAIIFFLNKKVKENLINIGSGFELNIKQYIDLISKFLDYDGKIIFDNNKILDGTPRKIVDIGLARKYGWKPKYGFKKGIEITINDFILKKNNKI